MAKKEPGQTEPTPEPEPKVPTPGEPVPEPKPEPEPEPDLPKEHQGKTPAQLVQELEGLQKKLGTQGKELGDVKSNFEYNQRLHDLEKQKWEEAQARPVDPNVPKPVDIDYTNPTPGITEIVQRELGKEREKQQRGQAEYQQNRANTLYMQGKGHMAENPKLYEGIESTTEQGVAEAYRRGYITAEELNLKSTWDNAATLIHVGNKDFTRLQEATVKPVTSTETELPTPAKPGTADAPNVSLDYTTGENQKMLKQYGLTKAEAEEIVKEEQEATLSGQRKETI